MIVTPDLQLKYSSSIWNLFAAESKYLMLELRDENSLTAVYDLYDIEKGGYQWKNLSASWRAGVSHFNKSIFVLHEYGTGTLPRVERLIVYTTATGEKINEIENMQPQKFTGRYVIGADSENNTLTIDLFTGEEVNGNINSSNDEMNTVHLPLTYKEETDSFIVVKEFVARYLQQEAIGIAEYLEFNDYIFLSFHVKNELLENWLVVIDQKGKIWLKEQIDKGDKYFSDTFFIWQNYLMFVIGKHELKAIKL
ncbi:MAG: DUF4905 domain-containing protein [Candidatus Cyclobacteriaceae bacterium M2_1C_046]